MEYADIAPMMSQLWAPIAAVTASHDGRDNAQIVVAVGGASIVPQRPRVVVQIYKTNLTHDMVRGSAAFALCFLRPDQMELVHDLGYQSGRDADKLARVPFERKVTGSPVFRECWGYVDCRVINAMDGGDMTVFLADVMDGATRGGEPLTWQHMRQAMPPEWMEEWGRKIEPEIEESLRVMDQIKPGGWPPG